MSRHADSLTRSGPAVPTDMASRALRCGLEGAVDEGASRLLAAKIAVVFQRAATCVRGTSEVAARELESVEVLGELFLKQGEVGEALAVFTSLSAGIRAGYETIWDEESEVGRILDACVDGLEGCLDAVEVDAQGDILGALLDIAVWERMSGGYGIGERAAEVLLGRCDAGERRALGAAAAFVLERATLDSGARQRLGSFVVELGGGAEAVEAAGVPEVTAASLLKGFDRTIGDPGDCSLDQTRTGGQGQHRVARVPTAHARR